MTNNPIQLGVHQCRVPVASVISTLSEANQWIEQPLFQLGNNVIEEVHLSTHCLNILHIYESHINSTKH